jgi:hypothetical protein
MKLSSTRLTTTPRWRGGRLMSTGQARPYRPVTDSWIGSADERLWQRGEDSPFEEAGDSWLSRARAW